MKTKNDARKVPICETRVVIFFLAGIAAMLIARPAPAQSPKAFEVVAIKPDRDGRGFDVGTTAGGRYNARNVPAKFLVLQAFGIRDYQLAGAPGWLDNTRYDIAAKINSSGQIGEEQLRPLLQAMLVERFGLRFHRETREFPGYSLVVGKSGPKFAANTSAREPGLSISSNRAGAKMTATRMPITALSKQLGDTLGRTVTDNTGLKGNFDFKLEWTPPETANTPDPSVFTSLQEQLGLKFPDVFTAVQEQLGLKLDAVRKTPAEVIVIDRVERASEN